MRLLTAFSYVPKWPFSGRQPGLSILCSIVTCLLKNTIDWYSGFDLGKLVGYVFIDFKKEFSTVDHQIFLDNLKLYGVEESYLSWFQAYPLNCKQFCRVDGINFIIGDSWARGATGLLLRSLTFLDI